MAESKAASFLWLYLQSSWVIPSFHLYWFQYKLGAMFLMNAVQCLSQKNSYIWFQNDIQGHHRQGCNINVNVLRFIPKTCFVSSSPSPVFNLTPSSDIQLAKWWCKSHGIWGQTVFNLIAVQWLWSYLFYLSLISFINELLILTDNFT